MTRAAAVSIALSSYLVACRDKPPKTTDDDNTKAFAELEKNDKDGTAGSPPVSRGGRDADAPRGPVLPAPFTAEQIHQATTTGRKFRYKVEVPNTPSREHVLTFKNVDESGAEVQSGGARARRFAWATLQAHMEFPRDRTKTREEKLTTPAGKFDCIVYAVAGDDGEVSTYYFAKTLPGAPVLFYVQINGKRVRTTTLIEHVPGR